MTAREQATAVVDSDVQSIHLESLRLVNLLIDEALSRPVVNERTLRYLLAHKAEALAKATK